MKKLYLIIFFIFNNYILLWGQSDKKDDASKYIPNILPTTPESFKFSNFGNIPIGMFTGAPNISIPITEFSSNNIKIPIKLNYSSNGINIDQMNGSVGLGWTFISAGVITKTVRDKPDENNTYTPKNVPLFDEKNLSTLKNLTEYLKNAEDDKYDTESDLYTANFGGNSISFLIDRFKKIIPINQGNYIIKKNFEGNEFSIFLEDGTQFNFNDKERIMNRLYGNGHSIPQTAIQSWYLSSIKTISGNIIHIIYNDINYTNIISQSQTTTFTEKTQKKYNTSKGVCDIINYNLDANDFGNIIQSRQTVFGKQISKIYDNSNSIEFFYSTQKEDYSLLNKVVKKSSDIIIEKIEFDYYKTKFDRVFLKNISNIISNLNYEFEYYNLNDLPERLSFSRDKWGYYNGNKNYSLIPGNLTQNDSPPNSIYFKSLPKYNGANQEINKNMGYYGLLKKIIYPTKGSTQLNYENHEIDGQTTIPPIYSSIDPVAATTNKSTTAKIKESFTPADNGYIEIYFTSGFIDAGECYNSKHNLANKNLGSLSISNNKGQLKEIYQLNNNTYISVGKSVNVKNSTMKYYIYGNSNEELTVDLSSFWFCTSSKAFVKFISKSSYDIPSNILIGGYRISSTIDSFENKKNIIRKYKYLNNDGKKSIHVAKYPIFIDDNISVSQCISERSGVKNEIQFEEPIYSNYRSITSSSIQSLFAFHPNVFYESVFEEIENNGSIQHIYNINTDQEAFQVKGLKKYSVPNTNTAWMNGKEIETIYRNNSGKILKKIYNEYYEDLGKTFYLGGISRQKIFEPNVKTDDTWNNFENMNISYYKNYSRFTYLKSQKTTEYFENKEPITTEVNYNYYSPNHLQLTKQTTTNSKGETLITEYQYPPDWKDNPIAQRLTAENRIAEPLTVVQKNGSNNVISAIYNEYNDFNGILQKSRVFQKKGDDKFAEGDDVITYNSYDNKGNITQYTPKNGIPVSIIWGYNGQYPVAKIEGLAYNDLMNSTNYTSNIINAIIYQTTVPNNRDFVANLLMQLRVNDFCKDAMVTGYIYKPLVGVAEIIQPNGQTEYYKYDDAGRLQEIKNDKGEVLKTFEYNYKN